MSRSLAGDKVSDIKKDVSTASTGTDHANRQAVCDTYVLWDSRTMESGTLEPSVAWEGKCELYGGRILLNGDKQITARYAVRPPYSARTTYTLNTVHRLACSPVIVAGQNYSEYACGLTTNRNGRLNQHFIHMRHRYYLDGTESLHIVSSLAFRFGQSVLDIIPQSQWNIDAMDGTGVSKISILSDRTKDNKQDDGIYYRTFTFVFVNENGPLGSWKVGVLVNGVLYFVHEFAVWRGNIYGSAAPAGPFNYACVPFASASGADAVLTVIYGEVTANGPCPSETPTRSNAFALPAEVTTGGTQPKPVLSVQLNSLAIDQMSNWLACSYMLPTQLCIANTGLVGAVYTVTVGATLTGAAFADQDIQRSIVAIDASASSMAGGSVVLVGFVLAGSSVAHDLSFIKGGRRVGVTCASAVRDVLTVAVHTGQEATSSVLVSLAWNEYH
jgi:hypothetical protein